MIENAWSELKYAGDIVICEIIYKTNLHENEFLYVFLYVLLKTQNLLSTLSTYGMVPHPKMCKNQTIKHDLGCEGSVRAEIWSGWSKMCQITCSNTSWCKLNQYLINFIKTCQKSWVKNPKNYRLCPEYIPPTVWQYATNNNNMNFFAHATEPTGNIKM